MMHMCIDMNYIYIYTCMYIYTCVFLGRCSIFVQNFSKKQQVSFLANVA